MKIKNKSCYAVTVLILSGALFFTGLTGCKNKEAQFLIDGLQEAKAEVDAEESEKQTAAEENEKNTDTADAPNDKSSSRKSETDSTELAEKTKTDKAGKDSSRAQAKSAESSSDIEAKAYPDAEMQQEMIYVDVCGAVANPGVFQLEAGSRVFQAIEAAGGYLPEAVPNCVNRAGVLTDGQQLYILTQQEMEQQGLSAAEMANASNGQMAGDTGTGTTAETASAGTEQQDNRININTADETQLTTLTGIGATRALAIIAYRQENGPFAAIEEIMNVQGIKEGTFAKIKDEIVVG